MRWSLSWLLNISQVFSGEWRLAMACIAWPSLSVSLTWSGRSFTFSPNASNQAFFPAGRNAPRRHRRETRGQRRKERRLSYSRIERFQYVEKYSYMWKNIPICGISLKAESITSRMVMLRLYNYTTTKLQRRIIYITVQNGEFRLKNHFMVSFPGPPVVQFN